MAEITALQELKVRAIAEHILPHVSPGPDADYRAFKLGCEMIDSFDVDSPAPGQYNVVTRDGRAPSVVINERLAGPTAVNAKGQTVRNAGAAVCRLTGNEGAVRNYGQPGGLHGGFPTPEHFKPAEFKNPFQR